MAKDTKEGSARTKMLVVTLALAAVGGGTLWWTWEDWAGRPGAGKTNESTVTIGQRLEQGIRPTVNIVPVPRIAPEIVPAQGIPVQLGTTPPYTDGVRKTVTLRHISGRADPMSMGMPKIDVVQKSGTYTTSPTILTEEGNCFSTSSEPDKNGTYCSFTIHWDPKPNEELKATIRSRIEAYVTQEMRVQAQALADVPGGWEGYELEIEIVGASAPEPAPAQVRSEPTQMVWPEGISKTTRMNVTVVAENRVVETGRIIVFPKNENIKIIEGRHGSCANKRMIPTIEPARCALEIEWTPTDEALTLNHELVIAWEEPSKKGERPEQEAPKRETIVKMTGRGIFIDPDEKGEAEITFDPEQVTFESIATNTRSTTKRVRVTVTGSPTVIEEITPEPTAKAEGLLVVNTEDCKRTHVPGKVTGNSWCFINVEVQGRGRTGDFFDRKIEVIWNLASSGARSEGIDRYITSLPISWKIHAAGEDQPEATTAGILVSSTKEDRFRDDRGRTHREKNHPRERHHRKRRTPDHEGKPRVRPSRPTKGSRRQRKRMHRN